MHEFVKILLYSAVLEKTKDSHSVNPKILSLSVYNSWFHFCSK